MAATLKVGQTIPFSIAYLDQNGNPMSPPPNPDAPPAWAQLNSASESLTAAPDGNTASATGLAAGSDTIQLSLSVGGNQFTATLDVTVEAAEPTQTLTSIQIVAGTPA